MVQILKKKFVSENKLRQEFVYVCNMTKQNNQKLELTSESHFGFCSGFADGGLGTSPYLQEDVKKTSGEKQTKRKVWAFIFEGSADETNYEMAASILEDA